VDELLGGHFEKECLGGGAVIVGMAVGMSVGVIVGMGVIMIVIVAVLLAFAGVKVFPAQALVDFLTVVLDGVDFVSRVLVLYQHKTDQQHSFRTQHNTTQLHCERLRTLDSSNTGGSVSGSVSVGGNA